MQGGYVRLEDQIVYKLAVELSDIAWHIYEPMTWQIKKIIGDQFITALDSFGANIAEGYGRYHYLDQIKFYYNARASLMEAKHWTNLLHARKLIADKVHQDFIYKLNNAHYQHNQFIKNCYQNKQASVSQKIISQ